MRTAADADDVGIACNDINAGCRYEEKITDDLRETGFMPLAARLRTDDDINASVGRHGNLRALVGRAGRGLPVIGKAQAAQLAFCRGLQTTRLETAPVGDEHSQDTV